ncbi:MAG: patatin-like phospholipase family protein [Lewinellaceae bacterium]|nr:patatin-like phospholipase family protein [Lewinellaceae bacterium]
MNHDNREDSRRALVISGGGSKGAFAGGISEHLIKECKHDYRLYVGTSAGSLLVPLLALGETDRLKHIFSNIRQEDIFSVCPFIIRKKDGVFHYKINHLNIVKMFFRGKKTFGESNNLLKLIHRLFTPEDYERLRHSDKEVVVSVSNLSTHQVEYKCLHECSYQDFCEWMWISANFVPFMSLVEKNGMEYADGGFGSYLPLQEAVLRGADEIDAIMLQPKGYPPKEELPVENAFGLLFRTIDFMLDQISFDDLYLGRIESKKRNVKLNCFYTPRVLTKNSFIFDAEQMANWWKEGYHFAGMHPASCHHINAPSRFINEP